MSAIEETKEISVSKGAAKTPARAASPSVLTRALRLLSSVRFGVTLLIMLVVGCVIGMLIMQQNVEGFDKYYAELSPATRLLFGALGFFDIYHAWYFNLLLLVLSLNIVLASIERFPGAWVYVRRKKLEAQPIWLRRQEQNATLRLAGGSAAEVAGRIKAAFEGAGLKATVTERAGKTYVFGERGAWNRLGAYAVHVALLTIFAGGFLTAQFGRTGTMTLAPGASSDEMHETVFNLDKLSQQTTKLPFTVECTDIQQTLIKKEGPITADNTFDWLTRVRIKDPERGETEALVHMNDPYDYRGYRFFQASFIANGKARSATIRVTPEAGGAPQDVTIPRDGTVTLPDGTRLTLKDFSANFRLGGNSQEAGDPSVYNNPAALLSVTRPGGQPTNAYAFTPAVAENAPFAKRPVEGYTYRLMDFEKVPEAHTLSVQKDPGATTVYVGFTLLALTLSSVFFFSHQRVWAVIEGTEGGAAEVVLGGNTNRNKLAFGDRFKRIVKALGGEASEEKVSHE